MIKLFFWFYFLVLSLNCLGAQTEQSVNIELEGLIAKQVSTTKYTHLVLPVPQQLISDNATLQLSAGIEKVKVKFSILSNWPNSKQILTNTIDKASSANYIRLLLIKVEQQTLPSNMLTLYWRNNQKNQLAHESSL
jgi:hypothetical protein